MITNGYLLDEATCAQLREYRVGHAQVTLDGPPDVHDRMRPLVSGGGTFDKIVRNLQHAVDYLPSRVRINVDAGNVGRVEELLQLLVEAGLAKRLSVNLGHLVGMAANPRSPSAAYGIGHRCLTMSEYATVERDFAALALSYGFATPSLPMPKAAPCTAVRANELVVGSRGELYQVLGLGRQRRGGHRPHPRLPGHQRSPAEVAQVRPLRQRRVPRVHGTAGLHGRLRQPRVRVRPVREPVRHLPAHLPGASGRRRRRGGRIGVSSFRVGLVGDVLFHRRLGTVIDEEASTPASAVSCLRGHDLVVANLEMPLTRRGSPMPKRTTVRSDPAVIEDVVGLGIGAVSLANNHAADYGPDGVLDTLAACAAAGIQACGAGRDKSSRRPAGHPRRSGTPRRPPGVLLPPAELLGRHRGPSRRGTPACAHGLRDRSGRPGGATRDGADRPGRGPDGTTSTPPAG